MVRQSCEFLGRADVALLAIVGAVDRMVRLEAPIDVLADVKIGIAITVEVGPGGAGSPQSFRQTGLLGHIDEFAAAFAVVHVTVKNHAMPAGDEYVRPAVAVVVADRDAVV